MKKKFSLIMFLVILFLYACHKKPVASPVQVSANEFVNLTLNGVNYSWKSSDSLYGGRINAGNGQFYTKILGATRWNISPLKMIELSFGDGTVAIGNYSLNVSVFINNVPASYVTSGNTATTNVTEYGATGNYIAGTASGQIIQVSSGTSFNFSCTYRIKRIM